MLDPALEPSARRAKDLPNWSISPRPTQRFPGLGVGVTRSLSGTAIRRRSKNLLRALTESLVFVQQPANKPVVVKILMKHLRLNDAQAAEEGYQDHLLTLNRKPYPSLDGLRNAQRLMAQQNPKIAALKVDDLSRRAFRAQAR